LYINTVVVIRVITTTVYWYL